MWHSSTPEYAHTHCIFICYCWNPPGPLGHTHHARCTPAHAHAPTQKPGPTQQPNSHQQLQQNIPAHTIMKLLKPQGTQHNAELKLSSSPRRHPHPGAAHLMNPTPSLITVPPQQPTPVRTARPTADARLYTNHQARLFHDHFPVMQWLITFFAMHFMRLPLLLGFSHCEAIS